LATSIGHVVAFFAHAGSSFLVSELVAAALSALANALINGQEVTRAFEAQVG